MGVPPAASAQHGLLGHRKSRIHFTQVHFFRWVEGILDPLSQSHSLAVFHLHMDDLVNPHPITRVRAAMDVRLSASGFGADQRLKYLKLLGRAE
jgi:hypothetical protein